MVMSREIYKPISWEEAAELMGDKDADEKLFVQEGNFELFNALQGQLNVGCLPKQNWYLRCEQREEHHTNDNDLPIRPEVSE